MKIGTLLKLFLILTVIFFASCSRKKNIQEGNVHPALQAKSVPSGLGVNTHFVEGSKKDYSMIEDAGIDIIREDVLWQRVEKEPGVYDFSVLDKYLKDLRDRDLRLLFILTYGNKLYDNGQAPYTAEGRAASARFCKAMAAHFAGEEIIWELWNEPNSDHWSPKENVADYMSWCKAVVPEIRKADPEACIIAPATSDIDIPYLEKAFEKGLLELVDGISIHPYRNPKRGPETTFDEYENIKVLIDLYKPTDKNIPVISGEWGYSSNFFISKEIQGKYLSRQWLNNIYSEVPISIWYDWHDDGTDPLNQDHGFGTVTHDYEPKPAFLAMKTLISQLRGNHLVGRIGSVSDDDYKLIFSDGNNYQIAAWTTGTAHKVFLGEGLSISNGTNMVGKTIQTIKTNTLFLNDSPAYYPLMGEIPEYVKLMEEAVHFNTEEKILVANGILQNKPENRYTKKLLEFLESGTKEEKIAACQILVKLAKSVEHEQKKALVLYDMILNSPASDRVKREALYRIAVIGDDNYKEEMKKFLHNPKFASAASVYFIQAARKYAERKMFKESLESLFTATKVTGLRHGPEKVFRKLKEMGWNDTIDKREMARENGFVDEWKIAGPFPNEGNGKMQPVFRGDKIELFGTKSVKWTSVQADNIWGIIPLAEMFGKIKSVTYAYCQVNSEKDIKAIFKTGTNDGVACWVNGSKVFENYVDRSLTIDEDAFNVELKKGSNTVLLEIPNSGGNWEFCLRICDTNGLPLMTGK